MLHQIELTDNYKERSKTTTTLHLIRKDRRHYKDIKEEAELLVEFSDTYKVAINQLKEVLGKMRKIEAYHSDRQYKPRFFIHNNQEKEQEK